MCAGKKLGQRRLEKKKKDRTTTEWHKCLISAEEVPFMGGWESRTQSLEECLRFISVAQHVNIPLWLHSDKPKPVDPSWVKREAPPKEKKDFHYSLERLLWWSRAPLPPPASVFIHGFCLVQPFLTWIKSLVGLLWAKEVGSNENNTV